MKFSSVAILATGAAAAVTPRDATDVQNVLKSVGTQVANLQKSVDGYNGGSVASQVKAGQALDDAINTGKKNIGTDSLGLVDAAGLADPVNSLAAQAKSLVAALSSKRPQVQSAGSCAQVSSIVAAVYKDGNDLVGSVIALVSDAAAKPIASSLASPLQAALSSASVDFNGDNCKGGSSGGSSSGGSGSSSSGGASSTGAGSSAATTTEASSTGAESTGAASTGGESTPGSGVVPTSAVTTPVIPGGGAATTPGTGVVPTAAAAAYAPAGALALAAAVLAL